MDLTGGENVSIGKTVGSGGPLEPHADPEQEPGHPWMNKKAKDEYKRALEQVLDKNFSLRKNGLHPGNIGNTADVIAQENLGTF